MSVPKSTYTVWLPPENPLPLTSSSYPVPRYDYLPQNRPLVTVGPGSLTRPRVLDMVSQSKKTLYPQTKNTGNSQSLTDTRQGPTPLPTDWRVLSDYGNPTPVNRRLTCQHPVLVGCEFPQPPSHWTRHPVRLTFPQSRLVVIVVDVHEERKSGLKVWLEILYYSRIGQKKRSSQTWYRIRHPLLLVTASVSVIRTQYTS